MMEESAKLRALRALVPCVSRALCPTCSRASRASCPTYLVPYVPLCLTCLVPCVLSCPTYLVPHVARTLPYVLSCLTCVTCFCTSRVLCLACSRAGSNSTCSFAPRPSLALGVSSVCISCLLAFMRRVSYAFVALAI